MTTLTDRQERFVREYMLDQNASAAARRCGYSPRSAASTASAMLQIPAVRDQVRMLMDELMAKLELRALDLMQERMRAAFFRSGWMFASDGRLLTIEAMDPEKRDLLDISFEMRGNTPILRLKQPSREKALAALEKARDKLDRLNEKYWDQLERDKKAQPPEPNARPKVRVPDFFLPDPPAPPEGETPLAEESAAQKPHDLSGSGKPEPAASEKPHDLSGSGKKEPEKPQGLSGSVKKSIFQETIERLRPRKKQDESEPYDFMKDPDACWGGRRKPRPEPEPSPALVEHMARVQMQQHNEEIRQALEARGGKVRPGPGQQLRRPGFDPWAQNRPQYAIGGGEYWVDDD